MKVSEIKNIFDRVKYYEDKKIMDLSDADIEDFIRLRKRVHEANELIKETVEIYQKIIKGNLK